MVSCLLQNYPNGYNTLFFIKSIGNFFFYGLKGSLVLYLRSQFKFSDAEAFNLYGIFMALSFLSPAFGGYLCDRFLGVRKSIRIATYLIFIGGLIITANDKIYLILGLALIIIGMGIFQPSTSAAVAKLFSSSKNLHLQNRAFVILYIGMNFGNFLGLMTCGLMTLFFHLKIAFLLSSFIFLAACAYSENYLKDIFSHSNKQIFWVGITIFLSILVSTHILWCLPNAKFVITIGLAILTLVFHKISLRSTPREKRDLRKIMVLTFLFCVFWIFSDQSGSSITLYVEEKIDRSFYNEIKLPTLFFQAANPVFVVLLGYSLISYLIPNNQIFIFTDILKRFAIGFFFVGLSLFSLTLSTLRAEIAQVAVIIALALQALGELIIIPIAYSTVAKLSPKKYSATIMGGWMMAVSLGHYLASIVAQFTLCNKAIQTLQMINVYRSFFYRLAFTSILLSIIILICINIFARKSH